jgi:murein L,D-transpeptidase YcbB/YkuD
MARIIAAAECVRNGVCFFLHVNHNKLASYLGLFLFLAGCSYWNQPSPAEINELKTKLQQQNVGQIVREIYEEREFRPVWIVRGRTLPKLKQFFQLVDDRSHGVHPEEYGVEKLRQEKHADPIQFDIDVTSALVNYTSALARKDVDLKKTLHEAINSDSIAHLADRIAPLHVEYARLRTALQKASGPDRRQIELNMDRWRKQPDDLGESHIRINVPAFELEVHDRSDIPLKMKVVVGTNENKTPLFGSEMKYIVFSPYWNIPQSILTKETLPRIMKDPEYATRQQLEVVRVSGKHVEIIDPNKIDWENIGESDIQLRQRPGSGNALGFVKFIFPNRYNVYLHDTPSDNLFDRLTRNFSHGCIRVEKPQELAEYVLRDQPEWTPEKIREAMHAGQEKHVPLKHPIPVHILYFTAWVDESGMLHLEKDVYGYDTRQ